MLLRPPAHECSLNVERCRRASTLNPVFRSSCRRTFPFAKRVHATTAAVFPPAANTFRFWLGKNTRRYNQVSIPTGRVVFTMGYSQDVDAAAVRAELTRIIASAPFENAERLVRFLTFVVEKTLAGSGSLLKESTIGVEVFGRPPDYDPKTDPIVRVQARRLRAKLDSWYQGAGQTSAIRIDLPKGGYQPEFRAPQLPEAAPETSVPQRRPTVRWLAPVTGLLLLGVAAAVFLLSFRTAPATPGS